MSRKKKFIENLTEQELITLDQGYKYGLKNDFRKRCHIILLSNRQISVKQISEILSLSSTSIYKTFNKWEDHGISGLIRRKGQGRKPNLDVNNAMHVELVKARIKVNPQKIDQELEQIAQELGVEPFSRWTLQRFLKRLTTPGSAFEED